MDEIRNIARNRILGLLADALVKGREGAQSVQANPVSPIMNRGAAGLLEMIIGKAPEVLDNASYGFGPSRGSGLATRVDPAVLDVAGMVPGPGTVAKVGKGAAKLIADAAVGGGGAMAALVPGGRRDLIATHATKPEGLLTFHGLDPTEKVLRSEIYSPSFAVSPSNQVSKHFATPHEGTAYLVPREGAFDPRVDTTSLFNRDTYTPRYGMYPGSKHKAYTTQKNTVKNRLSERFSGPPEGTSIKFGEGDPSEFKMDLSHEAAIRESPSFSSFKHFEKDPRGAATLKQDAKNDILDYGEAFKEKADDVGVSGYWDFFKGSVDSNAGMKRGESQSVDAARELISMARRAPSEYAELKAHGPVPLNTERFAGVAVTNPVKGVFGDMGGQKANQELLKTLVESLMARGIPVASPIRDHEFAIFDLAKQLQEQAPIYGKKAL